MSATDALTGSEPEHFQQAFARDGYFVIRNVVSRERLTELHQALSREFAAASQS